MKIYAVEKGSYSDRRVVACTLDENKAKRIAKSWSNEYKKARILEFEDGEYFNFPFWAVDIEDGVADETIENCSDWDNEESNFIEKDGKYAHFVIQAETPEIAKKIAIDRFFQWKAEQENLI